MRERDSAGASYVFTRSGGAWAQQAKPIAADSVAGDCFGWRVGLSGDTALISAVFRAVAGSDEGGAVYVFMRSGASWTQQAQLTAADGSPSDLFGYSVAVSGETVVVGAPYHDTAGKVDAGAAYIYTRTGASWAQQSIQIAFDSAAGDEFGRWVALSAATALVGAPGHSVSGKMFAGLAYVFVTAPRITEFLPASGTVGTDVTLLGTAFTGATAVTFNGSPAPSLTVDADAQITAVVPAGASCGPVAVTTAGGTAVSLQSFAVIPVPGLTKTKPTAGRRGAIVTLTGRGFGNARSMGFVKFGGKRCSKYFSRRATRIKCRVPSRATYGTVKVTVTTAGGMSRTVSFRVKR